MRDFLSRAAANIKEAHKKWQWVLNMEMVGKLGSTKEHLIDLSNFYGSAEKIPQSPIYIP